MTITIKQLQKRFPDCENWEDRGNGLYRGRTANVQYVYVLDLPDRHVPKPVRFSLLAEEPSPEVEIPYDTVRGGVAAMPVAIGLADDDEIEKHVRVQLRREIEYQNLPTCVVPDCQKKALCVFKAAEHGRLAGRDWRPGDEIRTCPEHANDIYLAQGVYGRDQLAEWLQPDAKLDPLDAFDAATDLLNRFEIERTRARMLRVKVLARD